MALASVTSAIASKSGGSYRERAQQCPSESRNSNSAAALPLNYGAHSKCRLAIRDSVTGFQTPALGVTSWQLKVEVANAERGHSANLRPPPVKEGIRGPEEDDDRWSSRCLTISVRFEDFLYAVPRGPAR